MKKKKKNKLPKIRISDNEKKQVESTNRLQIYLVSTLAYKTQIYQSKTNKNNWYSSIKKDTFYPLMLIKFVQPYIIS